MHNTLYLTPACFAFGSSLGSVPHRRQDKKFKKEMDALMASEEWKTGADDASKFLSDPVAMEAMRKQVTIGRQGDRHRVLDLASAPPPRPTS